MQNNIKVPMSVSRKLSIATGLLSFAAFVISGLGDTWGFAPVAKQITQTCLLVSGGISVFFLGSTTQKEIEEKKENDK